MKYEYAESVKGRLCHFQMVRLIVIEHKHVVLILCSSKDVVAVKLVQ